MYSYYNKELDFYHNINKYLSVYELNLIQNKKMYIYISLYTPNLFSRVKKYIDRGFKFIDKNNHSKYIIDDDDKIIIKIIDYIFTNITYNVMTYEIFCNIKDTYLNSLS